MKIYTLTALCFLWIGLVYSEIRVPEAVNKHIDSLLTKLAAKHHIPCLTAGYHVIHAKNGNILNQERWTWVDPQGYSNLENSIECAEDAVFRVASVSKAIGSGLIASLVEEEKLHWDDDVNKYVPVTIFPKKTWNGTAVTITIRQLISHLSGLRHTIDADLLHDYGLHITNTTQTVRFFASDPLLSAPGTHFHYSNNGWILLGAVVEAIEKRSYHQVLDEYMAKLVMSHTKSEDRSEVIPHKGSQYQVKHLPDGKVRLEPAPITDSLRPFPHWPAGGVISTADGLLSYGEAMLLSYHHYPGRFLKSDTVKTLWNYKPPVGIANDTLSDIEGRKHAHVQILYAMGWERIDFPADAKDRAWNHMTGVLHIGGVGGSSAILMIFPEANIAFSAIANIGGVGGALQALGLSAYHSIYSAFV